MNSSRLQNIKTMGGDAIHREPSMHKEILEDPMVIPIFTRVGWLEYFLKLIEYDNEMERDFAGTLKYDEATVKGLVVDSFEMEISQVTRLP